MEGQVTVEEYLFGSNENHSTILRNLINQLRSDYMPFCNQYTMLIRETSLFLTGHPQRLPLDALLDNYFLETLAFSNTHFVRRHLDALFPSDKGPWLLRLADILSRRFWRLNQKDDLEEAIWYYQKAVSLLPQTHYHFLEAILGLCSSVYQRFRLLGHLDDLKKLLDYLHIEQNLDLESLLTPVKARLLLNQEIRNSTQQIRRLNEELAMRGERRTLHLRGEGGEEIRVRWVA